MKEVVRRALFESLKKNASFNFAAQEFKIILI